MTAFVFSAICAVALNATASSAPADTVDTYLVNGRKVENFDGSQLERKFVTKYSIGRVKGRAERVHVISAKGIDEVLDTVRLSENPETGNFSKSAFTISYSVIDGKKASIGQLSDLAPDQIHGITVLKGDRAVKTYGEEAKNGAIIITTKGQKNTMPIETCNTVTDKVVYVLNGEVITKEKFDRINHSRITSLTILKDKEQTRKYTDEDCIVIQTTTK